MSEKPPGDDDPWKAVLDQVEVALGSMNLRSGSLGDALMEGVRDALSGGFNLDAEVDEGAPPHVVVLDGGKPDDATDEAPMPDTAPDLRVVNSDTDPSSPAHEVQSAVSFHPEVSVRVLRGAPATTAPAGSGQLRLSDAGAWQTVFRGATPRAYRVGCDTGVLHIALDGELVEEILPGQDIDLEGKLIRAQSGEGAASGWYLPLHGRDR